MIRPSPEICAVVRRALKAAQTKDAETILGVYSKDAALRYVGSELDEVFGGDVFRRGMVDHFAEAPPYQQSEDDLEAYESGKVGWALWRGTTTFLTDGREVAASYRISVVLVLEDGSWKIIQVHVSNPDAVFKSLGVPNDVMNALMDAAQEGPLGLGTSGMASVMFTDVADSAALANLLGDRLWTQRIDTHLREVRRIVEAAGGTLVKSLGDGTMSTFTSSRYALAAARDVLRATDDDTQKPKLRLRIGLHTGEVIENRGDFFGTVVNKAARIAAVAQPGEVLLSDATRMMAEGADFTFADPAVVALKGLDGDHLLHRLEWRT